jgi:type IV pilus assembly protein PilQ
VSDGSNLVIAVPSGGIAVVEQPAEEAAEPVLAAAPDMLSTTVMTASAPEAAIEEKEIAASDETVEVPPVAVQTDTPKVEFMLARAVPAPEPVALEPVAEAPAEAVEEVVEEPVVTEMNETVEVEPEPADEPMMLSQAVAEPVEAAEIAEEIIEEPVAPEPIETAVVEPEPAAEPILFTQAETAAVVEEVVEEPVETAAVEPEPVAVEPAPESAPIMLARAVTEPEPAKAAYVAEEPVEAVVAEPEPAPIMLAEAAAEPMEEMAGSEMVAMPEQPAEPIAVAEDYPSVAETIPAMPVVVEPEPAVVSEPAPEGTVAVSKSPSEQILVTLTFRDADLNAVLEILARKGNLNILAGREVRGTVTVRLVDVPLDVALNAILNVNGYGYVMENNIVRIAPLSELGEIVNTVTETYTLSYASAQKAKDTLKSFLTSNGKIEIDERTNMLLITDTPTNMERIRALIPHIDRRVQQVLIEVLILDSVLTGEADLGISWNLVNDSDRSLNNNVPGGEGESSSLADQVGVNLPRNVQALNLVLGTVMGDFKLNTFIEAAVSDSDSKVLANPKILTLNNETATIEIIEEFPYNDVTQTSSGGELSNITFKEIGTKLEVKPQITHDGHVILYVAPEQNSIAATTATGVPVVDTRRAETTLIVRDHQTIVLGGLRENRRVKGVTKVPLLGDLPGVKYAFRSVESDKRDTELLVFITVHIVESPPLLPHEQIKSEELANLPRRLNTAIEIIR